jgi:hypothetical protein
VTVAEIPEADEAPPRIDSKADMGIVIAPPSVPFESVMVYGVLPPEARVVRLNVALNVPESVIPPESAAVPAAAYEVPELEAVSVALMLTLTLTVEASAAAQTNKTAVRTRNIISSVGRP